MTRRYLRTVRAAIGDTDAETRIEQLLIRFEIRHEATDTPASGTIDFFNLADATETRIRDRGEQIRLWAGYGDDPPLIAAGDVRRVERMRADQDRITRVHFGGHVALQTSATFQRAYEGTVTVREIVTDIVAAMGLELGPLDAIPEDATVEDVTHGGGARFWLTQRLRPLGVEWYEESGVIRFTRQATSVDDRRGDDTVVVSETTGMVGTPTTTDDGVRVRTLLDARITLDTRFRIVTAVTGERATEISAGEFKAVTVTHAGDNRDGNFHTEIEGRPVA